MPDRKSPPPFVKSTSFELIEPITHSLPNGVNILFIPGGNQDVIKIEVVAKAGRWNEKVRGAAQFTGNLLNKGTSSKNSFQIAQIFDQYGAHIEIHPGMDYISATIYSLNSFIEPVLDLFFEVLTDPSFPEKEIEQVKTIAIQNLKVNHEKTSFLASKLFRKKLFGENHPYGYELEENDLNSIKRDDLLTHYRAWLSDIVIFVSGKIDSKTETLISKRFSAFTKATTHSNGIAAKGWAKFHEQVEKEGSVQASIRAGRDSLMRDHVDYPEVIFVTHLLGGYFGSRLMKNIREEKGLTYGIYSSIHPLQHASYLVIGADVNKENVGLTISEIRKEIKLLYTEQVGHDELTTAKNHFIGSLQSEITTPFAHADKIKTIYLSNLPKDYYKNIIGRINSITPERIIEIAEKYLNTESISDVAVG
jgi:zinc protease